MARSITSGFCFFVLAAIAALSGANRASAALGNTAFSLSIAPSTRVLSALGTPDFYDVLYDESCDNPLVRIYRRNKPALLLENDPTSGSPITSFTLEIKNPGPYLFGTGDFPADNFTNYIKNSIYTDPGVDITGSSVSGGGKLLTVNFSGLTAGKKAIFCIDIDTSDANAYQFPDYRGVLLGAPMQNGDAPTLPALVAAIFTDQSNPANTRTVIDQFEQLTEVPDFHDVVVRPYHTEDKIEVHTIGIAEPSALGLAALGIVALAGRRRLL